MADRWLGLVSPRRRGDLRKALDSIDRGASLLFVDCAAELRNASISAVTPTGVIVGPVDEGISDINVAAAVVRDAMAAEVVLAAESPSEDFRDRAKRAGVRRVVDIAALAREGIPDLDEPSLSEDEVPTMVVGMGPGALDDGGAKGSRARVDDAKTLSWKGAPEGDDVWRGAAHATQGVTSAAAQGDPDGMRKGGCTAPSTRRTLLAGVPSMDGPGPSPATVPEAGPACEPSPGQGPGHGPAPQRFDERGPGGGDVPGFGTSRVAGSTPGAVPVGSVGPAPAESGREQVADVLGGPACRQAPLITFVSGRGGVGKTSLVAAMAWAAASWGMRVGVCDLDLSCGNLYSLFGASGPADLGVLVGGQAHGEGAEALGKPVAEGVTLWGPCVLPEMAEQVSTRTADVLAAARSICDVVLVDTATAVVDAVAEAAQACDRLVIVVDGRAGSAQAQARWGSLAVRLGVARTRIVRLANRVGPRGEEPLLNRAEVGLETARPLRVLEGGSEVSECLAEGEIGELFELRSRFAESAAGGIAKLLSELGALPEVAGAQHALNYKAQRSRWSFGRRKEAS